VPPPSGSGGGIAYPLAVRFLIVRPEVSGHAVAGDSISFDTWLGDDLVAAHPHLVVTTPLKKDLERIPAASGFAIARIRAVTSRFFRRHSPGKRLPVFWLVRIRGTAGRDDIGIAEDGATVVSPRVFDVLLEHKVGRATFSQYVSVRRR
jgi:hypothetical protein